MTGHDNLRRTERRRGEDEEHRRYDPETASHKDAAGYPTLGFLVVQRLLIANRGEIALRIMRACAAEGIDAVAVAAHDDTGSLHARTAAEVVEISSYLDAAEIVRAARTSGADAVHPGYGFLSESAELAEAAIA
ncbi:MAG: biotin carboxylase N-terminal domain-containing protein, partial [Actinomycetota bacterium]